MLTGQMALFAIVTGAADLIGDDVVFHTPQGDVVVPITKLNNEEYLNKIRVIG